MISLETVHLAIVDSESDLCHISVLFIHLIFLPHLDLQLLPRARCGLQESQGAPCCSGVHQKVQEGDLRGFHAEHDTATQGQLLFYLCRTHR